MNPSIKIEDLNHFYGEKELTKQVLFDINLEIKPGEIVILTGPSGSGKTTLLSLIGALRSVQNGSLQELNQELYGASEEQLVQIRRHIGYIFQAHNLLPFLTARENVQMSIELHENISKKQAIAKSEAILKEVGLGERINYYPDNLSGGKTGRDVVNLMQILAKEQHCTILLVTHDDRILDIADRVIHMEDGRLNTATNLLITNSKK